jgi:hypothetical protein
MLRRLAPIVGALVLACAAPATAATHAQKPMKNGYWAQASTKSADLSMLVAQHGKKISQVYLQCTPTDAGQGVYIGVEAVGAKRKGTKLTFSGSAPVNDGSYGDGSFATTTFKVKLTYKAGTWKGSATTPACTSKTQGAVTLVPAG